jgi:hypothetical protein
MTDQQQPITPSFELMDKWWRKACRDPYYGGKLILPKTLKVIATEAARWGADQQLKLDADQIAQAYQEGADQELEACEMYLAQSPYPSWAKDIRAARRPKPPTLNSIALQMLGTIERDAHYLPEITDTIRKALEKNND